MAYFIYNYAECRYAECRAALKTIYNCKLQL